MSFQHQDLKACLCLVKSTLYYTTSTLLVICSALSVLIYMYTKLLFSFLCVFLLDLTELQVAVSEVNGRYETLGGELKDRLGRQQASLELRQKTREGTEELKNWLTDKEHSLKQGQTASPSKPEVVRAQAQANKVKDWVHLSCMVCDSFPI